MTIPTIGPVGGPDNSGARDRMKEPVTNEQAMKFVAFTFVVLPTAVAVNVLIWTLVAWIGRQS